MILSSRIICMIRCMAVGNDVCMIHDLEGELYEYDLEGETAAEDE